MGPFEMLAISGSALGAERQRSEVIATNMANAETTHTDAGGPFQRKQVVFSAPGGAAFPLQFANAGSQLRGRTPGGVRVAQVVADPAPPVMRYEPGHPDANKDGFVAYPAINPVQEMVDLMGAVRAYQLNASAVTAAKQMIQQSLDILKS
ncbi:MAG TPA: flagellar basal body rod protein FlgC [Acidobacteriaceae bacterium]